MSSVLYRVTDDRGGVANIRAIGPWQAAEEYAECDAIDQMDAWGDERTVTVFCPLGTIYTFTVVVELRPRALATLKYEAPK